MNERIAVLETPSFAHGSAHLDVATTALPRAARWADFVAGEENRATVAAVMWLLEDATASSDATQADVAKTPAGSVVLYGPSGVGKTHLLRTLAQAWSAQRNGAAIEMLSALEWNDAYVAAVNDHRIDAFRRRFRECDLLILDELHRLGPKSSAQAELIHTLDALEARGAAVAFSLVHSPAKTDDLLPGLTSRLSGGAVVEVSPASIPTRRTLLAETVVRHGLTVEANVVELLAADRALSVPEMIGSLLSWHEIAQHERVPLDLSLARKQIEQRGGGYVPTMRTIAEHAARRFGLTLADLKSESRRRTIVLARDTAMLLARRLTKKSLLEIGSYFGGRDHTTVMHSCRKAEALLEQDAESRTLFAELQRAIEHTQSS